MNEDMKKYIDLGQFPKSKTGDVSWKDSVGMTVEFFYYGKKHFMQILGYGKPSKDYIEIKVDDMPPEIVATQKVKKLRFDKLFGRPNYLYNIGDTVNGFIILEQLHIKNENNNDTCKRKHYKCKCLIDGYEYIFNEREIKSKKCPMCNCLATTNPEVVEFLLNKDDAYIYTRGSRKYVWVVCPFCKHKKQMAVNELTSKGLSCPICSDGLSYPNKFAHSVFEQIREQYEEYCSEYTPDWVGQMRYDNYVRFKDGREIIVEMDGGFHYNNYGKLSAKNDKIKDVLAKEHEIKVIRINCFYHKIIERFEIVKNGIINNLKDYFNLSYVDWEKANKNGISNKLIEAIDYYKQHPFATNQQIADIFHVNVVTIRHYLTVGEELGLCTYVRHDPNRWKTSIPLALYDENLNFVGAFISSRHMAEAMSDKGFRPTSIRECVREGRLYKGYLIKKITWEEYERYQNIS